MKTLLAVIFLLASVHYTSANIIYVKANATGSNTGTSWTNAFTDLQSGIAATTTGDQIWVAAGTYKPTNTTNQQIYFRLPNGVQLYGGFVGTETLVTQRDWVTNQTILSGDIGTTGSSSDNSWHVVFAYNVSSNTRLDGFNIIDGHASNIDYHYYGGGMEVTNSSLTVANCIFTANYTANGGGALAQSDDGSSTPGVLNLINCSFVYNNGDMGSALFLRGAQCNITNCNISNNDGGRAIDITNGTVNIDRCVISGNSLTGGFGIIDVSEYGGTLNMYNSLIAGNLSDEGSALHVSLANANPHVIWNCTVAGNKSSATDPNFSYAMCLNDQATMRNSIVWGNSGNRPIYLSSSDIAQSVIQGGYAAGVMVSSADPLFANAGNAAVAPYDAVGYNYHLLPSSPAINSGDNTYTSNLYNLDLDDSTRISGIKVDRGCYEKQFCVASVSISASGPTSFCNGGFVTLTASGIGTYAWSNGASSINTAVSTPGTYMVTVVDTAGCLGTASKAVTVYQAAVQITGNTVICNNTSTTLTATSADGNIFSWSNSSNGAAVTVTQAGNYTVTVTTGNSCTASANATVSAHSVTTPVISQSGNTLTSSAGTGNQWYFNGNLINGATTQTYTATQNGNYTVVVTESGCTSTASNAIDVVSVGIDELKQTTISVFPNPATNQLNVVVAQTMVGAQLNLYDISGKLIKTTQLQSAESKFEIENFPSGFYIAEVKFLSTVQRLSWVKM